MKILLELMSNIAQRGEGAAAEISQRFYRSYYLNLLQDIFYVLTDRMHKSCFPLQALALSQMIRMVQTGTASVGFVLNLILFFNF